MLKNLNKIKSHYLNKICTIITSTPSIPIKSGADHSTFFTGEVTDIDEDGIHVRSPQYKTMAFFQFPIIGIIEEQMIPDDSTKGQEIKQKLEESNKPKQQQIKNFTSIEELKAKVLKSKN